MTAGERADLQFLLTFMRDWRREDGEWKDDVSKRLRAVEDYVTADDAKNKVKSDAGVGLRARLAIAISMVSVLASSILTIISIATR